MAFGLKSSIVYITFILYLSIETILPTEKKNLNYQCKRVRFNYNNNQILVRRYRCATLTFDAIIGCLYYIILYYLIKIKIISASYIFSI